jgi:hypothetical protein
LKNGEWVGSCMLRRKVISIIEDKIRKIKGRKRDGIFFRALVSISRKAIKSAT